MDIDINTIKILYLRKLRKFFSSKYELICSKYRQIDKKITNELKKPDNNPITNIVVEELNKQKGEYFLYMDWLHKIDNFVLNWVNHDVIRENQSIMTIPDNEYIISCIEYEIILLVLHECSHISLECEKFIKGLLINGYISQIVNILDKSNTNRDKLVFQFISFVDTKLIDRRTIYELHEMCKSFDSLNANYIDERVYQIIIKKYNSITKSSEPIEISSNENVD